MAYFSVAEAKAKLSDLIAMAERGEEVIITRSGKPVIDFCKHKTKGLTLGSGANDPTVNRDAVDCDDWWRAMNDDEAEDFLHGR